MPLIGIVENCRASAPACRFGWTAGRNACPPSLDGGRHDYNRSPFGIKTRSSKSKPLNKQRETRGRDCALKDGDVIVQVQSAQDRFAETPAPISAARVAVPMLITALVLIPARIEREAIGR